MAFMGCIIGINETYNQYEHNILNSNKSKVQEEIETFLTSNKRMFSGKINNYQSHTKNFAL